jgi:hypothetical protein
MLVTTTNRVHRETAMTTLPVTKHIDVTQWPVMRYTAPAGVVSDEHMREVFDEQYTMKKLGELHAICLDLRASGGLTPTQRKMLTAEMGRDEALTRRVTAGVALVFTSAVLRGVLTAIFWVRPAIAPTKVFSDVDVALAWCRGQIEHKRAADLRSSL